MKTLRLLLLLFILPFSIHAQKTLTGLWTGILSNDSTTVRKDQSFEIALTQYKDKVYGYSRSTFIVNDTLYYILKRVKGKINGDVCEIEDDNILSYNFRGKLDKKVKVTTTFRMNRQDSSWSLAGEWTTNKTKKFYSVSGSVDLKEESDLEKSKIFPHLEELDVAKEIPFYAEAKKTAADKQRIAAAPKKDPPVAKNTVKPPVTKPVEKPAEKPASIKEEPVVVNKPVEKKTEPVAINKPAETINPPVKKEEPIVAVNIPEQKKTTTETVNPPVKKTEPVVINKPVEKKTEPVVVNKPVEKKAEPIAINKPVETINPPVKKEEPPVVKVTEPKKIDITPVMNKPVVASGAAVAVNDRKTLAPQEVIFTSDSLQLALYDNGEIDGDTVSVLLNGEIILAKQGLKASAIRKTIYIQPGQDELTVVLYAENLGKYAPNTGLLVVYDGEERYQVRFSADLQQNASVIFRRKK